MNRGTGFWLIAALLSACESDPPPVNPPAPASAAPSAVAPAPAPTPRSDATFTSEDGAALAGDLYVASDLAAPCVVLVHRLNGDRSEFAPLAQRLAKAPKRFTVLSFDLRGHGASKPPEKAKPGDTSSLFKDVDAAIRHVLDVTKGKSKGVVLVGTSLGAALVTEVAFRQAKVTGLALVSPGASIAGHDLYRPYAEIRNLPTFIAGAKEDTVSSEPLGTLEKMASKGTIKRYDGPRHSAAHLAEQHPELWDDLESWLMQAFELAPTPRVSLQYAPGKEPGAKRKPAGPKGAR